MPTILILGATSDIGAAIARLFASKKFDVQLAARDTTRLITLKNDLSIRYGTRCDLYTFDAIDFFSHADFYGKLQPKPDVSVCVFGYMNENEDVAKSVSETLKTIQTNYTGAVTILNTIAEDYALKKKGTIIGISSVAGERGRQSNYLYGSAKAGFTAYLSGLRNKLFQNGIPVITILPGFVNTRMTEHLKLPKLLTASPEEVAQCVYKAFQKKQNTVYVKWYWKWIMCIIRLIPESIFKRMKL
ncbi:MAG: SDR family oxidoreductase [Chitinophagaceae bacterium]|nr:SDR family oxidoreductase [Chitinophagaceae bacterium]